MATKLREPEPEKKVDLVRAHEMLMRFSRNTLSCRQRNVTESRERFEDLAVEVADDALLTCLAFLRERGAVPRFGLPHIVNACALR
ncbi:MAG: hypothetical protein V2J16_11745, partial [Thermoleophilia bacterium]|nr:hypothetical protein [Thermoleophilia bacterium]